MNDKAPVRKSIKPFHKPFENSIDLDIEIPNDAPIEVQFLDLSGKLIMTKRLGNVSTGKNMLQFTIHDLATEVHIMRIDTRREVIRKKVFS